MSKDILPKRKRTRLKNFNYNWVSSYFITICTNDKKCILGTVTKRYIENDNEISREQKISVCADVKLSSIGKTVEKYIESSKKAYENVIGIENYVIMPNHIHLVIYVCPNNEKESSSNALIPRYVSALKHLVNKECGGNIFQRSYYDHIIRNDKDFDNISNYIDSNPICWEKDCFYVKAEDKTVGDDAHGVPLPYN